MQNDSLQSFVVQLYMHYHVSNFNFEVGQSRHNLNCFIYYYKSIKMHHVFYGDDHKLKCP